MEVLEERLPEEGGGNKPVPNPHPALGFPQLGCERGVSEHRLGSEGVAALTPCPANLPSAAPSGPPRVRTPGERCDQVREDRDSLPPPHSRFWHRPLPTRLLRWGFGQSARRSGRLSLAIG